MTEPYLTDADVTLYQGDAVEVLSGLPDESVHMCVTSPPFYGLRDYNCEGQIGLEETPDMWVDSLVAVFREVRRVLRHDATLWLEVGDSYNAHPGQRKTTDKAGVKQSTNDGSLGAPSRYTDSCKPKDLLGMPWALAFALRADGWYLRSEIIWAKPNPMPESVTDRPTTAHSRIFLLAKSPRYFFDAEAVREPHHPDGRRKTVHDHLTDKSHPNYDNVGNGNERWPNGGRNVRSVWEIATQPFPEAHFATFPEALVRRCILAGSSERGCCPVCGAPLVREVETEGEWRAQHERVGKHDGTIYRVNPGGGVKGPNTTTRTTTTGWRPSCAHERTYAVSATILDPFMGSGTTAHVAHKHGRRAIGIDLNADYLGMAARRLQQQSLFA